MRKEPDHLHFLRRFCRATVKERVAYYRARAAWCREHKKFRDFAPGWDNLALKIAPTDRIANTCQDL